MAADSPTVSLGSTGSGLYICVNGRATQRTCPTVDRLVSDFLAGQPEAPEIVIDLAGCEWLDSTFAGWMMGLQKRLTRVAGSKLRISGCSERCRASLDRMQLAGVFTLESVPVPAELTQVPCLTTDRPDRAALKIMLQAHQELAAVSEANARVFGPVVEVLRRQLDAAP
jgi:anti-anti-sigma regulatory factor